VSIAKGFKKRIAILITENKILHLHKYSLLFILLLTLDQVSKIIIRNICEFGKHYKIIGNFFWITFIQNPGAVFGISLGSELKNQLIFTIISIIATFFLIYLFIKSSHPFSRFGFTLILSGAVGNLIDRIALGKVTDFLDFNFFDSIVRRWYTFNIADACIVVGVIVLLIYYIFLEKPK